MWLIFVGGCPRPCILVNGWLAKGGASACLDRARLSFKDIVCHLVLCLSKSWGCTLVGSVFELVLHLLSYSHLLISSYFCDLKGKSKLKSVHCNTALYRSLIKMFIINVGKRFLWYTRKLTMFFVPSPWICFSTKFVVNFLCSQVVSFGSF